MICDTDYRGEYIVAMHNDTDEFMEIQPGERIAQLILIPFEPIKFEETNLISKTERGTGGFGHSGSF